MDDLVPTNPSEVKEIERITREAMTPELQQAEGCKPVVALPDNLNLYDLDEFLEQPRRVKRTLEATDIDTLNRYWDKWAIGDAEIFADLAKLQVRMRFDEHTLIAPAWGDHCAIYNCPKGKEWAEWENNNKTRMSQEEFGEFLEDRAKEVVEPIGTDLIALTQHFAVGQNVSYTKAVRQTDGNVAFAYSQENQPSGEIKIPETFKLALAPFHNGTKYEVSARFRYRVNTGNLSMWYELIEPWRVIEHAFNEVVESVEEHTSQDVSRVVMGSL